MQGGVGHEGGGAGASVCVGSSRAVGCPCLSRAGIVLPRDADGSRHRQRFSEAQVWSRGLGAVGACERTQCLLSVVHHLGHAGFQRLCSVCLSCISRAVPQPQLSRWSNLSLSTCWEAHASDLSSLLSGSQMGAVRSASLCPTPCPVLPSAAQVPKRVPEPVQA